MLITHIIKSPVIFLIQFTLWQLNICKLAWIMAAMVFSRTTIMINASKKSCVTILNKSAILWFLGTSGVLSSLPRCHSFNFLLCYMYNINSFEAESSRFLTWLFQKINIIIKKLKFNMKISLQLNFNEQKMFLQPNIILYTIIIWSNCYHAIYFTFINCQS